MDNSLTSSQRAYLRSLAHPQKAVMQVGREGVSEPVVDAVREALHGRELLKVRVPEAAPLDVREAAEALAHRIEGLQVVQTIGRVAVLYRPDPEAPRIQLPA